MSMKSKLSHVGYDIAFHGLRFNESCFGFLAVEHSDLFRSPDFVLRISL
jgi:hypothetical protein